VLRAPYAGPRAAYAPPDRALSGRSRAHSSEAGRSPFHHPLVGRPSPAPCRREAPAFEGNGHPDDEPRSPGMRGKGARARGGPLGYLSKT
jgi:hypothetical protein